MKHEEVIKKALASVAALEKGKIFMVKDLFTGTEWNDLKRGDRTSIGRFFKKRVVEGQVPHVAYEGKHPNNSALYKKI